MSPQKTYVPAAGHDLFLPFYDPVQRLLGADAAREGLIAAAGIRPGQRVLDVGCGTGDLLVALGRRHPDAEIVGLDPDPKALRRASRKIQERELRVRLDEGFSNALPYADGSYDRVFSTFMFHHLDAETKTATLAEIHRVLAPGGAIHLLDFATAPEHHDGLLARLLHRADHMRDNQDDRILAMLGAADLTEARRVSERRTLFGRVAHFEGRRE